MIAALLLLSLVGLAAPQRSPYLSSQSVEYPGLLPRFRPSTTAPSENSSGIGNRIGETQPEAPFAEGTLYDSQTIDRVAQWPKEKQPFWFVNRQQIASHRGTPLNGTD